MNKEYKELEVLSVRLAESVLMDWDKEEPVILVKEVETKCHSIFNDKEIREFVSLVKRMREAQKEKKAFKSEMYRKYRGNDWFMSEGEQIKEQELYNNVFDLESEVDEYLKKMEEEL